MGGDPSDRLGQCFLVGVVVGEVGDVDEVAPAGVGGASLESGDDLHGEDQLDAVPPDADRWSSENPGNGDLGGRPLVDAVLRRSR